MDLWKKRTLIGEYGQDIFKNSEDHVTEDTSPPWKSLLQDLSDFYLDVLCAIFKEKVYTKDPNKQKNDLGLHKEEFVTAISEVFGHDNHSVHAIQLFNDIDRYQKKLVTWNEFLDFLGNPKELNLAPKVKLCSPKIFTLPHAERETVSKIVLIETEKHFCYAMVSKYGRVGLYDGNLNFLTSYQAIFAREDVQRTDEERRRRNRWITDAIFLVDIFMFVLATSTSSLTFYDASGLKHVPMWLILGTPHVITSISYTGIGKKGATLFLGDETGTVTSLQFLQPRTSLFRKKYNEKLNYYYWRELAEEKNHVSIKQKIAHSHKEQVNVMDYFMDGQTLVTCSRDKKTSVVIKPSDYKLKTVVFSIRHGVSTFTYSKKLCIIITGCDDGNIQLWNHLMSSKPLAILQGHNAGIVDLAIIESCTYLLSCSRDAVLILWDITTHKKLQYIKLKYPPFEILGRFIEWGKRCIFPGPKRQNINEKRPKSTLKVALGGQFEVNKSIAEDSVKETEEKEDSDALFPNYSCWERSYILVTCCNFIAKLEMSFFDIEVAQTLEPAVLVPPPLQNSVLVPYSWNLSNKEKEETIEQLEVNDKLTKYIDSLGFILNRDFLNEPNMKNDINLRIAKLERRKLKMKNVVSQCAPFLALDLPVIEEVRINPNLTVPNVKNVKNLVEKTNRILSSAASRSQIFSDSSSRSKSSRSSIVEFEI